MSFVYQPKAPWIQESHLVSFLKRLGLSYAELQARSEQEPAWFWAECLKEIDLEFDQTYTKLLAGDLAFPEWARGAKISIVRNCIDRHLPTLAKETALRFYPDEEGPAVEWSFEDLARESSYICKLLQDSAAQPGDRVALLMPMSLEMVACFFGVLRAGLSLIPIFSGYGAEAVIARLQQSEAKFVFLQKKTTRKGKELPILESFEKEIRPACPQLKKHFILEREDFLRGHAKQEIIPPHSFEAEEPCLFLYTSGTTGEPKACVHTNFGVLATTGKEHRFHFDVRRSDRFFWYTDIGWMMGPWELCGALQFAASVVLYEGVPDYPDPNRIWRILEDANVTQFGISPTAIRVLKKEGNPLIDQLDLPHLRILGSTGEPWDDESWQWYFERVGKKKCPVINISGGTEIMGCLLAPSLLQALKPSSLGGPALGVKIAAWSEEGTAVSEGIGHLVCLAPLPSMTKAFLGSKDRYLQTYFERFGNKVWYHGDWAYIDSDGQWFLKGRSDDTIKVAGKRVGPNEYESALMEDPRVAEVAAVGIPHPIKGEGVHCFVVLKSSLTEKEKVEAELKKRIIQRMGKSLGAESLYFVEALPKTRSGKILRSLIRKIRLGEPISEDVAENSQSLEAIRKVLV
ncbi:MAG: AMP-dependent synthetase [Bradymonadales bacterium]|nr:MAG: AMP-dependent synthetase [Bradymonadales bacterium]